MKILLKNAKVVNVFSCELIKENVLIENNCIIGVGNYSAKDADKIIDCTGKILCPGFIDGHIHIESTMLTPFEFAKVCIPHGTTGVVCDPHEITNVCGHDGLKFMMDSCKNIPLDFYFMIPSCVPATKFDESGAKFEAKDISPYYNNKNVLGLAEMMNYVGVVYGDKSVLNKVRDAITKGKIVNGHAPMLLGKDLDKYISSGIYDDHECTTFDEALEKLRKGQRIMIRQGTAARNLQALLPLFDSKYAERCLLVTDDKHPYDLLTNGHIDAIVREAVKNGKDALLAIKMASYGTSQAFNLKDRGAIAPGYKADILVLKDLKSIKIEMVIKDGNLIYSNNKLVKFDKPEVCTRLNNIVLNSVNMKTLTEKDFMVKGVNCPIRIIKILPGQLITDEIRANLNFELSNGIDLKNDIIKIAVFERHLGTNHKFVGYVNGFGMKSGAIASTVSHDSHNLIVVGTNEKDMALACNKIKEIGGGNVVVKDGKVIGLLPLNIAGLMSECSAEKVSKQNSDLRLSVDKLGVKKGIEPFMNMAFLSLSVIPNLKITTKGLIDVKSQKKVDLFVTKKCN